jgi:uracil-DNA glycosylase
LGDERRRYLEQQIELGGAEIVMDTPPSAAAGSAARSAGGSGSAGAGVARETEADEREPTQADAAARATRDTGDGAPTPPGRPADRPDSPAWLRGAPPIPGPGLSVTSPEHRLLGNDLHTLETLDAVAERIRTTYCCALCPNRTNAVPGEGDPAARLVCVGEGPGATEDAQGRPFVGQAGQLLDSILQAIDVPRPAVYITNIVKCRPPQNRKPLPDEIAACIPYLHRQLELLRPKVILAMGGTAGEALLGVKKSLGELRGKVHTYNGIPLVVTYHPAALLRNPNWKKPTWDDVRIARQLLDR